MRYILNILMAFLLLAAPSLAAASAAEGGVVASGPDVAGISGLPLMPDLTEIADETVVFDKPEGRIVDAVAVGDVTEAAVAAWYEAELPAFGWSPLVDGVADGLLMVREAELLHIRLRRTEGGALAVHFSVAPYLPE